MAAIPSLSSHGVGFKVDPQNPQQMRMLRNLVLLTGIILTLGVTLCSLHGNGTLNIPCAVRNWVIAPSNGICSAVFLMSLFGYFIAKSSQPRPSDITPPEKALHITNV